MKKITSLSLGFSFLIISYTGVILFIAPHGRVSKWLDWHFLGLDKTQYQELHTTSMVVYLILTILHIYYNWKPIVSYMKDSSKKISFTKKEFLIALVLNLLLVVGTLTSIQPFKGFLDFGEVIKESWGEKTSLNTIDLNGEIKAIKPPPEQLGRKTLNELDEKKYIMIDLAIKNLKSKGFADANKESRIREIADELDLSTTDIYKIITQE